MRGTRVISIVLTFLVIFSLISTIITIMADQALGPAFNTLEKIPLIKPRRGIIPANYTHYLTFYYYVNNSNIKNQYLKREKTIQTFYLGKNDVRVFGVMKYNTSENIITDFDMENLNYTVKYRFAQYFNTSCKTYYSCVWINKEKYEPILYDKHNLIYTTNINDTLLLVTYLDKPFTPITTVKYENFKIFRKSTQILITFMKEGNIKQYILDLGSVYDRKGFFKYPDIPTTLSLGYFKPFHITSAKLVGDKLLLSQTSLGRPGTSLYGFKKEYIDFVNMNLTVLDENYTVIRNVGVVLAILDINNLSSIKAVYLTSRGFNITAKAIPTSDGGFLALLLSRNKALVVKISSSLTIEWTSELRSDDPVFDLPKSLTLIDGHLKFSQLVETKLGYAILLPYNQLPLIVSFNKSGAITWIAKLNTTIYRFIDYTVFSSSGDYIYFAWFVPSRSGPPESWITLISVNGKVLGSYHNGNRIQENLGLFMNVNGELGKTITFLTRPCGYFYVPRNDGYIDAGYLTEDYLAAELGNFDPFRNWRDNVDDLSRGKGWIVYRDIDQFNITISNNIEVNISEYYSPLVFSEGEWVKSFINGTLKVEATPIKTVILDKRDVEFRYSFVYPVAVMPDEVNFGKIHVGETKAIDIEIIWLVRAEVSGSIAYHNIRVEDTSFSFGNVSIPGVINGTIHQILYYLTHTSNDTYGIRIRFRIIFSPKTPGFHTTTFGIGSAPKGAYIWSPISWDYPRQIVPVVGEAVPNNESISTEAYPIEIGISAIANSIPGHVVVGSAYRETFYITNIGTSEMVFVYIGWALPGNTIVKLEGADMILGKYPDNSSAYLISFTLRIKPMETRRVDVYLRLSRELGDPNSLYFVLTKYRWPQGMIMGEAASLPPGLWMMLLKNRTDDNLQSFITEAMNVSQQYIDQQLYRLFTSGSEDEVVDMLYHMRINNPDLYNYIFYLIERKTALNDEWLFSRKYSVMVNATDIVNKKIRAPVYYLKRNEKGSLEYVNPEQTSLLNNRFKSELSRYPIEQYHSALQYCMENPLVCMGEFFKPKEFLETSAQGVIGLGKGLVNAITLGFVDLKADNEYQFSGKIGGIIIGNIVLNIAEAKLVQWAGRGIEAAGSFMAERLALRLEKWASTRRIVPTIDLSRDSMHLYAVQKLNTKYPIRFSIESVNFVGGERRIGTIIKWALNGARKEQGWYLGIGYVRTNPAKVGSKLIYKTYFHFYPRVWKIVVWSHEAGDFIDIFVFDEYILPLLKTFSNLRALYEIMKSIPESYDQEYALASFSADPNHLTLNPSGYVSDLTTNISAIIQFENLKNATAPAQNITIKLYIKGKIDPGSIIIWSTDHPEAFKGYKIEVNESYTTVTVRFININLPPNKSPPEGEGSVTIIFSARNDLGPGDTIEAFADVYFDYNKPVRTNTEKIIYDPNPPKLELETSIDKGKVSVKVTGNDEESGIRDCVIAILDEYGRPVKYDKVELGQIIKYTLSSGKYFVKVYALDKAGNEATVKKEIEVMGTTKTTTTTSTTTTQPLLTTTTKASTTTTQSTNQTTYTTTQSGGLNPLYIASIVVMLVIIAYFAFRRRQKQ